MICYNVITNGYDTLKEPTYVTPGWEYICFSDVKQKSKVWDYRITKKPNKEIKILGHKELGNVPALYVDGSITITDNLDNFVQACRREWSLWKHPLRDCIFDEAEAVIKHKGFEREVVDEQMKRYWDMPRNWGLGQTGVILRDFSIDWVRELSTMWYYEVTHGVPRDQLSLMWCAWAMHRHLHLVPNVIVCKYFKLHFHLNNLWDYNK